MQQLITHRASELFYHFGIKRIAMDDIARKTGMSKKTVYRFFPDKEALIQSIVKETIDESSEAMKHCLQISANAVEEVFNQVRFSFAGWINIEPVFYYELEKSFPDIWSELLKYTEASLAPNIINNLERGIKEGLYREDLNICFTAQLRIMQVQAIVRRVSIGGGMDATSLHDELTRFYLHAITTAKGKRKMKLLFDKETAGNINSVNENNLRVNQTNIDSK